MKDEIKVKILDALICLKEEGPSDEAFGICFNLNNNMMFSYKKETNDFLKETMPKWSEYSGNIEYPVKHPDMDPQDAFNIVRNLWEDEYGDNRLALLDFLIETLQGELV